jgi:hypothetical protein
MVSCICRFHLVKKYPDIETIDITAEDGSGETVWECVYKNNSPQVVRGSEQ